MGWPFPVPLRSVTSVTTVATASMWVGFERCLPLSLRSVTSVTTVTARWCGVFLPVSQKCYIRYIHYTAVMCVGLVR